MIWIKLLNFIFEVAHETKDGDVRVVFLKLKDLVLETYENSAAALCDGAVDHIAFAQYVK